MGITHSTVEVRWENLAVETDVFVGSRALPTVTNAFLDYAQVYKLSVILLWLLQLQLWLCNPSKVAPADNQPA